LFYRAIKLNIKLFRWDRALEIAQNNKVHVETVVGIDFWFQNLSFSLQKEIYGKNWKGRNKQEVCQA
jgi:hypothetical protein